MNLKPEQRKGQTVAIDEGSRSYESMSKAELEIFAVSAIKTHRVLIAADQEVYDEWSRASEDPSVPRSVVQALQDEYLSRQKKSEAQQRDLSDIIDALGFVPDVPGDDEDQD